MLKTCNWYYCRSPGVADHVISLCAGHAYLANRKGRWRQGAGDLTPLPDPKDCCVCMGTATIARMRNAPLKP